MKYLVFGLSTSHWQKAVIIDHIKQLLKDGNSVTFVDADILSFNHWDFPISKLFSRFIFRFKLYLMFRNFEMGYKFQYRFANITFKKKKLGVVPQVIYEELITTLRDSAPCEFHSYKLKSHLISKYFSTRSFALETLNREMPDQVVIFNGRFLLERAVWDAATLLNYEVYFLERFSPQWNNRYFVFREAVHSTKYRSSEMLTFYNDNPLDVEQKKRIAIDWFEKRKEGISQNFTRSQFMKFSKKSYKEKIVSFYHSSEDELLGFGLDIFEWTNQFELIDILTEIIHSQQGYKLIVRIHPNLLNKSPREIRKWEEFSQSRSNSFVEFLSPSSPVNSYDLLDHSESIVTYGSTFGVEAAFFEKRSILCGEAFHDHMDIQTIARTRNSLMEQLFSPISKVGLSPMKENAIKYGFFHSESGQIISGLRIVGDSSIQDPWFKLNGITLKPSKLSSLIYRVEKYLYVKLNLQSARKCSHL